MDQSKVNPQSETYTATALLSAGLFLSQAPRYAQPGTAVDISELALLLLDYSDRFETALRHYLDEPTPTYRLLDQQIQAFIDLDERSALMMIGCALTAVEQRLLAQAAYEYLDRLAQTRQHVNQLFHA